MHTQPNTLIHRIYLCTYVHTYAYPHKHTHTQQVGVGVVFKPSFRGATFLALEVHSLVPGSSAEECGGIQIGDLLQSIDGQDVYRYVNVYPYSRENQCKCYKNIHEISMYQHFSIRMCACTAHMGIHTYTHVHMHIQLRNTCIPSCKYIHTYLYMHTYICTH
jgi:hypothetical protein